MPDTVTRTFLNRAASPCNGQVVRDYFSQSTVDINQPFIDEEKRDRVTFVHIAARYGKLSLVRLLVELDADINLPGSTGDTPLISAITSGYSDIIKLLIGSGARVKQCGRDGITPPVFYLVKADPASFFSWKTTVPGFTGWDSSNGEEEILQCLVLMFEQRVDLDSVDTGGRSLLHHAALLGRAKIVSELLDRAVEVNTFDEYWNTPLIAALSPPKCTPDIAELLVDKGAQSHFLPEMNDSPLRLAVINRCIRLVEKLLENGASANEQYRGGRTPLHTAAQEQLPRIATILLKSGADPRPLDHSGFSPLMKALAHDPRGEGIGGVLLSHACQQDNCKDILTIQNNKGDHPFLAACREGNNDAIKFMAENLDLDVNRLILLDAGEDRVEWVTGLHIAARHGQLETIKCLLQYGGELNRKTAEEKTALHLAAGNGHLEVVTFLLEKGMLPTVVDNTGLTPLHYAAFFGREAVSRRLLDAGANVGAVDEDNRTPLYVAVQNNHLPVVKILISHYVHEVHKFRYAHKKDMHVASRYGITPLMHAIENKNLECAIHLIANGANILDKNNCGETTLCYAAEAGHIEAVQYLLDKGADVTTRTTEGFTPLFFAVQGGNPECVKRLIEHGADISVTNMDGYSPFYQAAHQGHQTIVENLAGCGADVNQEYGPFRETALSAAIAQGHYQLSQWLIEHGAEINTPGDEGQTPLMLAVKCDRTDIVKLLVKRGADINRSSDFGLTPLHFVTAMYQHIEDEDIAALNTAADNHLKIAKFLLKNRADINKKAMKEQTPLHMATYSSRIKKDHGLLKLYLNRGASINEADIDGDTVMHFAARWGNCDLFRLFFNKGGDPYIKNNQNQTPYSLAVSEIRPWRTGLDKVARRLAKKTSARIRPALDSGHRIIELNTIPPAGGVVDDEQDLLEATDPVSWFTKAFQLFSIK